MKPDDPVSAEPVTTRGPTDARKTSRRATVGVRLSRTTISLEEGEYDELVRRLAQRGPGGVKASRDLQARKAFTPEQKPAVLDLLNRWRREVGADAFGRPLADLRVEIHADVNPYA